MLFSLRKSSKPIIRSFIGMLCGIANDIVLKKSLTIFVYHDISDDPSEFSYTFNLNVYPKVFDYQINFIKDNFNIISPDDLLKSQIPTKAALVTFDDGFRSYFKKAVPILEKYKVPSIIFLNMEPVKGAVCWSGLITYLCEKKEDFRNYLKSSLSKRTDKKSLFLFCSRNLVASYMKNTGKSFEKEVSQFVGEFATEKDLAEASVKPLVFFGNHLFNHDVPLLLSDEELLDSYFKNIDELKKYPNYRNMFSFPFGRPGTCYSDKQMNLLFQNGAEKIFSAYGVINSNSSSSYLHRIPLCSFHDSSAKIWFQICQQTLKNQLKYYPRCL